MKKKILTIGIIAMLITMLVVLTGCRKTENENINETVESRNQISNSENNENQISKTFNNDEEILEEYIKALNNRNVNDIMNMYDIDGMNEYAKEFAKSDKTESESDLRNRFNKYIDIMEEFEINYKLSKFYIVHNKSDMEEMYKSENKDLPALPAETGDYWDKLNDMLKKYTICYASFTISSNYSNEGKETGGTIIWNNNNGKIIYDSSISSIGRYYESVKETQKEKNSGSGLVPAIE